MLASLYHEGYEGPLLELIRRRGVQAGLVIKVRIMFFHAQGLQGLVIRPTRGSSSDPASFDIVHE